MPRLAATAADNVVATAGFDGVVAVAADDDFVLHRRSGQKTQNDFLLILLRENEESRQIAVRFNTEQG